MFSTENALLCWSLLPDSNINYHTEDEGSALT